MKKVVLLILLVVLSLNLNAQQKKKDIPFNIGLYGGLNFNFHTPDFGYGVIALDGTWVGNMTHRSNATSIGANLGLIANIPLDNMFVISGRLGYNMLGGDLKDTVGTNTTHSKLNYLEISPILQIHNLIEDSPLYFLAGLEIGIPLTTSTSGHYTSTLTSGDYVIPDTDIPEAITRFALAIGAGWTFEISDDIFLSPEVSYRLPFTKIANANPILTAASFNPWDVPQLRASLNLTFGIRPSEETVVEESKANGEISVTMADITGLDMQGNRMPIEQVKVEETQYTELFPLLPYVFFDVNSDKPSASSQVMFASNEAGSSFSLENLEPDAVKINSSTLDILGSRMQSDKNAAIKLIGTVDAKNESPKSDLAKRRAEFVKNYLVTNYGIDASRITVEATGLPSKPSSIKDKDGIDENRRVEIVPLNSNSSLLKPIVLHSDKQRLSTPPIVQFTPKISANEEVDGWEMEIKQSDRLLKRYSGYGSPDKIQWSISPNELESNEIPADYNLSVWTKSGAKSNYSGSIPVEFLSISKKKSQDTPDKTISKYSLVLFDFDSPKISDLDQSVLNEYVMPNIKYNSTVQIYGYSDRIGAEDYNKKLATSRANTVKELINKKAIDAKVEVFGVGEGVQIYDNNLTTGRQLSRTVQIYVITPKK
ncbi:MAG TPA: OmpA family protein [Candidatus Kapabacteria bacterium]|nr:OmpA family protein [Candidatus Kapabacteria bacterium]